MLMEDPIPTFSFLAQELKKLQLGYLHIIESRVNNNVDCESSESIEFLLETWDIATPVLLAGGYTSENVWDAADTKYAPYEVVFVFGRWFLSNPDLVWRIREGAVLNGYDRGTNYVQGETEEEGYTDYSFAEGFVDGEVRCA